MKKIISGICVGLGFLSVGLGVLGILLPILPTTPFLLLAAVFFARGSERFHEWFTNTKLYKKYMEQTFEKKQMTRQGKCSVLAMVTVLLGIGFILSPVYARAVIGVVLALHYYYFLFRIKTIGKQEESGKDKEYVS